MNNSRNHSFGNPGWQAEKCFYCSKITRGHGFGYFSTFPVFLLFYHELKHRIILLQIAVTANLILCELYLTEDDTLGSTDLYKLNTDSQSDSEDDNMAGDDSNVRLKTTLEIY